MDFLIRPAFAQPQPPAAIKVQYDFGHFDSLGQVVNALMPIAFSIAGIMVVFYFIIGAFELITSQGDKAHIISGRAKIYHAVIGLILLLILFLTVQFVFDTLLKTQPNQPNAIEVI